MAPGGARRVGGLLALAAGIAGIAGTWACGGSTGPGDSARGPVPTRSFRMGFTPFPYAATPQAANDLYQKVRDNGDMIAHHLDGGIPWPEALAGTAYDPAVEAELTDRLARTDPSEPVYLAITPLNGTRDGLADYWGSSQGLPRPGPWAARNLASPEVIDAFVNYSLDLIDRFQPRWFNYGIEVSELAFNNSGEFDRLLTFASQVYPRIKAAHPELPTFVSLAMKAPDIARAFKLQLAWGALEPFSDYVGASVYPYIFFSQTNGDPATLAADWLTQLRVLARGKPIVVAETAWIAEPLLIPEFGVNVAAVPQNQSDYVDRLLSEADALGAEFVVWFFAVDFDRLWEGLLGRDPVARIWRDTGLWDESLTARPALSAWRDWLIRRPK
ncbi:MAG: hypothetical protein ACE5HQ_08785 [Gemmatimonadota bacterium]